MRRYLWNVLVAFDVLCNSLVGGNPRETFSSRVGRAMRTHAVKWFSAIPWPAWLRKHFLTTDDRAPE